MDFSCDGGGTGTGTALCDADRFLKGADSLAETIGAAKARLSGLLFVEQSIRLVERFFARLSWFSNYAPCAWHPCCIAPSLISKIVYKPTQRTRTQV
jgi:hypothetical protein